MYPVVFLAIIMAGGVFSGANPMYKAGELRHHFEVSETKFVFSDPASLAAVSEASEGLLDARNIIVWGDEEVNSWSGARLSLGNLIAALTTKPGPETPLPSSCRQVAPQACPRWLPDHT